MATIQTISEISISRRIRSGVGKGRKVWLKIAT